MNRVLVIAEAGVNHCGDLNRALELVDAAASVGADAVKFQTFRAELVASPLAETAEYQKKTVGAQSQLDMLRKLELSDEQHRRILHRCNQQQIEFMSTPFDIDSAKFLLSLGVRRMKVPSGELTNDGYLRELAQLGIPMIVSTGMASLHEVLHAMSTIRSAASSVARVIPETVLLHCTSNYPVAAENVNLLAMSTMAEVTGLPVGYSDHTLGINASIAAVALGATVIEKHFTLDRNLPGPDHSASLEPWEFEELVSAVREVEVMRGSREKRPAASELSVRDVVRRSVAAAHGMKRGHRISEGDVICLRPGTGIQPQELPLVIGRVLTRDVNSGDLLRRDWLQ